MISLQGCFIGWVRTSSPVIFALCQISTKIPLFGDRIWGLNLLYHLLLVLWEAYSWYIWFTFSLSVGSIWTTRTQECITACAVTARSSGKDRERYWRTTALQISYSSVSFEAWDQYMPMLFLIALLICHGCYEESCFCEILARLDYFQHLEQLTRLLSLYSSSCIPEK